LKSWVDYQEKIFLSEGSDISKRSLYVDRVKKALRFINSGGIVLDLGCNDGSITDLIFKMGCKVIGVDLPKVAQNAKKNFPNIEFTSFNIEEKFPFENNYFNYILAGEIIEHIIDDDSFLKECYRVLKQNGKLIITTPNIAFIRNRIWLLFGRYFDCGSHFHNYTFRNLRKKINVTGFKKVIEKGAVYDLGFSSLIKNFRCHFKYGYQNPLWYLIECILPKNFKSTIVMVATK
jgi:2-polyprenyl-3-methyl-5-hydroxy-6-metoxy-1,4-benzoquinol methylase